tara:strand:+ start:65 stop:478 length:414 start_codon:yes stop_codon:yes gene_type:complete
MLEKSNSLELFKFKEKERVRKQIYYKNNTNIIKEKIANYNKLNSEKRKLAVKKSFIKCTYGIVYEDYLSMHREQEYKCKICKRHADEFKKGLVVDHNHKTDKVRALLCVNCNSQLHVLENKELYDKYMNYLNEYKDQ